MNRRPLVTIGMMLGGWLGGLVPALWGAGGLSFSSLVFSALGAMAGVFLGFRLSE